MHLVGIAISLVCLGYFSVKALHAWQSVGSGVMPQDVVKRFALSSVPLLLSYGAAALAWAALLRCFGLRAAAGSSAGIYLTAQLGKYLPGNVGHYIGRAALATQRGYPGSTLALSMTLELVLLLGIAALLSIPMLALAVGKLRVAWQSAALGKLLALALVIVCVVAVLVLWRWRLLARPQYWLRNLNLAFGRPAGLGWMGLAAALLTLGICLSSIPLLTLGDRSLHFHLPQVTAIVSLYSVAWIVGVLTPGLPVGLGVREAILVQGLTPLLGASGAVGSALLFRLLTTLTDVTAFGIGVLLLKLTASEAKPQSEAAI